MAENKAKLLEEQKKHIQKIKRENVKYALLSILGIFIFLLIWQLAVEFGLVNETRLPKPTTILQTLGYKIYNQAPDGNTLGINILASLQVALTGFLTAMVIGIPLGLFMGWWEYADRFIRPIFELVRPVPPIAWIPLVVVWMGIGLKAKAMIIFFTAFVPCVINSYTGIKLTNKTLINVSRTFGASNVEIFCITDGICRNPCSSRKLLVYAGSSRNACSKCRFRLHDPDRKNHRKTGHRYCRYGYDRSNRRGSLRNIILC